MSIDRLDDLLGRFALWRRIRGGVWEGWLRRDGAVKWYGPFAWTYRERVRAFEGADAAALSIIRAAIATRRLESYDLCDITKPALTCIGQPLTEDRRQ